MTSESISQWVGRAVRLAILEELFMEIEVLVAIEAEAAEVISEEDLEVVIEEDSEAVIEEAVDSVIEVDEVAAEALVIVAEERQEPANSRELKLCYE